MRLHRLVERVSAIEGARLPDESIEIEDVVIDSRRVDPGDLFVAMRGTQADGHDFVDDACRAGAAALLVERDRADAILDQTEGPVLTAEQTRRALGPLSAEFFEHPSRSLEIVGITGTNGKTTISHLLASIVEARSDRHGVVGTIRHRWSGGSQKGLNTTPESLELQRLWRQMVEDDVERVALEVSSHALATHRMRGTVVDRGVFTNLTRDHLDFHGDMASYRRAKERLFTEVLPRSAEAGAAPEAIVNVDDPVGRELVEIVEAQSIPVTSYGLEAESPDVGGEIVEATLEGTTVRIEPAEGRSWRVELNLLGDYNAHNALAAAAVAETMGIERETIRQGLASVEAIEGRLERVPGDGGPHVYVDYAHTPDALERVLETLRPLTPGRLVAVFGCGGDRDRQKRPEMGRVARTAADRLWVTSDNPRSESPEAIIEAILDGLPEGEQTTHVEPDRGRAIERAVDRAEADDVILIAGKGHEQYQEIDGERRDFDDVERARRALDSS